MAPFLPPEVVDAILSWCDDDTLRVATQVTRDAERHLYRFIHLNSSTRYTALKAAIEADPRRGNLVRGMRLLSEDDYLRCTELLAMLPNLKRLSVTPLCDGFALLPTGFPFRLRRLRVIGESDLLTPEEFVQFLEEQPEIEVLELVQDVNTERWERISERAIDEDKPLLLPKLKVLHAWMDVLLAFLWYPRPLLQEIAVQTMTGVLLPGFEPVRETAPELCATIMYAGVDLRSLTIGTFDAAETLRLLAEATPGLQTLNLIIADGEPLEKFCSEFEVEDRSKIDIPALPSLRRFVLHVLEVQRLLHIHRNAALKWWELEVYDEDDNPTLLRPEETDCCDPLDEAYADQDFFCGN
ncbi:hypothetical protein AURDEDRAFT_121997 [Auricularia subglabra TFB-10046 SS5]|nr:hypothetical protein AURDEDRAFT_121997 [Auricularia subglabra TFB-10046 SS5]